MKTPLLTKRKIEVIEKARLALNGKHFSLKELKSLTAELEALDQFNYASEILLEQITMAESVGIPVPLKDKQTLAKYIYKDQSLPSSLKYKKALDVLNLVDDLSISRRCETLGLAGAIYKRKWQYNHQFKNLILSRYYYKRGYDEWCEYIKNGGALWDKKSGFNDLGFTAINYAYLNELMAVDMLEEHGKVTNITPGIVERLQEAENVRLHIINVLTQYETSEDFKKHFDKWVYPTIAEAYFGTRQYDKAAIYIRKYINVSISENTTDGDPDNESVAWEARTFHQQLLVIAYLQLFQQEYILSNTENVPKDHILGRVSIEIDIRKINDCINTFRDLDGGTAETEIKQDGKLGLALSGGGFRASIFHIGVLAALAEADRLKEVEVISCVSGGSIIGAYYYLKLKLLLEEKEDSTISRDDYVNLVKEIETDFLKGVQHNLRFKLLTDPWKTLQMIYKKDYSRTHRIAELYEEYLYNDLLGKQDDDEPIYMHDLYINPAGEKNFRLATNNWHRKNKIPQLVLNATCLNTGHNWQFTASWMGEPPGAIQTDIDVKPRLRRMYYSDAPKEYQKFRLGYAVGASSCVPVLFAPLMLKDLYPGVDLQLIDGGLHDNQGIGALIEQECNDMIISDASGQMGTNTEPTRGMGGVFYRADTILQERLRELQFKDIQERSQTTQIRELVKIHLKDGLQSKPVNWKHCDDPARKIMYNFTDKDESALTEYGVLISVQQALSEIRTDLDSFHDTEAYGLMYSGYQQTKLKLNDETSPAIEWDFLKIGKQMTNAEEAQETIKKLKLSKNLFFKGIILLGLQEPVKWSLIGLVVVIAGAAIYKLQSQYYFSLQKAIITGFVTVFSIAFLFAAVMVVYGVYVWIFEEAYNRYGKLRE